MKFSITEVENSVKVPHPQVLTEQVSRAYGIYKYDEPWCDCMFRFICQCILGFNCHMQGSIA